MGGGIVNSSIGGPRYIHDYPHVAVPFLVIASAATVIGTVGNLCILTAILVSKQLRNSRNAFLVNLAIADLCVTGLADPFSILGMVKGRQYFDDRPILCNFIAVLCLTSCVTALLSIGGISFNRYFHICHHQFYLKVSTLRNNIIMCIVFWLAGFSFSLPTLIGWSRNVYDHKMLECIWDRTHSLSFTIFFSLGIVLTPALIIAFSYVKIYLRIRASKTKLAEISNTTANADRSKTIKLVRVFFITFLAFVLCWLPYATVVLIDFNDQMPHEVHLFVLLIAHVHSTLNCIIYLVTSQHFKQGYLNIFYILTCKKQEVRSQSSSSYRNGTRKTSQVSTSC